MNNKVGNFKEGIKIGKGLIKGNPPKNLGINLMLGGLGLMIIGFIMVVFFGILLILLLFLF